MKKIFISLFLITFAIYSKGHYSSINKIIPLLDNDSIISIGKDEQIITWNLKNYEITRNIDFNRGTLTNGILMTEKGYLVLSNKEGYLFFLSLSTWTLIDIKNPFMGQLENIYSLGNNLLLLIGKKGEVRIYNYNSDRIIKSVVLSEYITTSTLFNKILYIGNQKGKLIEINLNNLKVTTLIEESLNNQINKIIKKNKDIYFSTFDGYIYLFRDNKLFQIDKVDNSYTTDILHTKKGLLTSFSNGSIRLYKERELVREININHKINNFFIKDNLLVVVDDFGFIYFYSLDSLELIKSSTDY